MADEPVMAVSLPRVLLLFLAPIYVVYLIAPAIGYMHDDGLYLVTAKALAAGRGYVIESLPNVIPQTKYPILYPSLLAALWKLSGSLSVVGFLAKVLSLACAAGWLLLIRHVARKQLSDDTAVDWVIFFVASSPWLVFLSTSVLPDTLFALLSTGAVLLLLREDVDSISGLRFAALAGVLAGSAFLLRTTGIALIAAGALVLLWRSPRRAVLFLLVCGIIAAPWLYWQASHPAPQDAIDLYYSKASYAKGHILAGYSAYQMFKVVCLNIAVFAYGLINGMQNLPAILSMFAGLVGLGFALTGWFGSRFPRVNILSVWLGLYLGMLICWVWPPVRYAVPVIPFLLIYLAQGTLQIRWGLGASRFAQGMLVVCGLSAVGTCAAGAVKTFEIGTPVMGWNEGERWAEYQQMAAWIQANTGEKAVLSGNLDPLLFLTSERKAIRLFKHSPYELFYGSSNASAAVGSPEEIRALLKSHGVTHIVLTPMKGFREGDLFPKTFAELVQRLPGAIRLVKQWPRNGYAIYQVNQGAL